MYVTVVQILIPPNQITLLVATDPIPIPHRHGPSTPYELFSDVSLNTLNASLYASNSALTLVRSVTKASSSNNSSANRSGLYKLVTRRCWIASREKFT